MKGKKIYIIIFIISIVGLAVVQYQYLRIGLNLAKVQFNQKMGVTTTEIKDDLKQRDELTFLVGKAITQDDSYFSLSIDSVTTASSYFLNDYLEDKLLQQGIKTEFSYTIYDKDSTDYLQSTTRYKNDDNLLKYPIILEGYLPSSVEKKLTLELQFKNLNSYFLSQLNGLTIPSLLFIVIIISVVIWVLKSFYWQKKLITTTNEFINNLTHELKTPVFSIGIASKILEDKTQNEHKDLVNLIRNQVDKLKHQIDKVLELASIEGKKNFIEKKSVDFKPVVLKLIKDFEQLAAIEHIIFTAEVRDDNYRINCDAYHLENAINSLLDNAKRYSENHIEITLKSYIVNQQLFISIKDNGIGISEEDQKNIFDKYFRVTSGDVHNVKGYGLGLNYVKRIVNLHNGKISVHSALGKGSEFIIKLPLYTYGK